MCHVYVPAGQPEPAVRRTEILIPLPGGEHQPALRCAPDDDAGRPGVLVLADVYGRSPFYEHLTALLAQAGFVAVLPDAFFRQGPLKGSGSADAFARRRELDETRTLRDMSSCVTWLREHTGVEMVGTVGFCMGATFGLDLASLGDGLVTVAYYGFPVPQASLVAPPPAPLGLAALLRGPVLAFWGADDETVGIENVAAYLAAARDADARLDARILPGLGHGFLGAADLASGTDDAARSWAASLKHLHDHLAR